MRYPLLVAPGATYCWVDPEGSWRQTTVFGRSWPFLLAGRVHNERSVGDGADVYGLLDQPSKQEAPKLRAPPIEAECKFVEVALQVIPLDGPLVGSEKPPLQQRRHPVHRGQVYVSRVAAGGDVDPLPVVAVLAETVVALSGIGSDRGAGERDIAHKADETVTADVGDLAKPHSAKAFRPD